MNAKNIAGLAGPALIVITISETINARIWATNIAPCVHFNGAVLFVAGLAIIQAHSHWARDWTVLVTVTGWSLMLVGLTRMFLPELYLKGVQTTGLAFVIPTISVLVLGVYLTLKGYHQGAA